MEMEIRRIRTDEFEIWLQAIETAFSGVPTPEDVENERRVASMDRCVAAFDGVEIVGGAAAYPLRMQVPGGEVDVAGITSVGVKPTHRRRGINTALIRWQLDDARRRGTSVAALFASEGGIYGRFGFGLGTFLASIDIATDHASFVRGYQPGGRVRLRSPDEALADMLRVYETERAGRPGMTAVDEAWMRWRLHDHDWERKDPTFIAVHEGDAGADAYAVYKVKHEWPGSIPQLELTLHQLHATTPQAYADMWRYLFDMDLIRRVTAWGRPADEALLHLLAEPRRLQLTLKDGLWVRLVDLPRALEARGYATQGRIVVEVRDRFCPWNEGRYALEVSAEGVGCTRTDEEPDISGTVNALGAVYLGGTSFRQLWRAGQVEERTPGALARADVIFAWDPLPWCAFVF